MELSHKRLRLFANLLIAIIWVGGVAVIFYLFGSRVFSENMELRESYFSDDRKHYEFNNGNNLGINPINSETETLIKTESKNIANLHSYDSFSSSGKMVFGNKYSFLQYFENQFPANELLKEYRKVLEKSGSGANPHQIIVELTKKDTSSMRFGDKFRVSLKFQIKPVPE